MRITRTGLLMAGFLALAACGKKSAGDTVDDSQLTAMNGAGLMEGTTNDAAVLDGALTGAATAEPAEPAGNEADKPETARPDAGKSN